MHTNHIRPSQPALPLFRREGHHVGIKRWRAFGWAGQESEVKEESERDRGRQCLIFVGACMT